MSLYRSNGEAAERRARTTQRTACESLRRRGMNGHRSSDDEGRPSGVDADEVLKAIDEVFEGHRPSGDEGPPEW